MYIVLHYVVVWHKKGFTEVFANHSVIDLKPVCLGEWATVTLNTERVSSYRKHPEQRLLVQYFIPVSLQFNVQNITLLMSIIL